MQKSRNWIRVGWGDFISTHIKKTAILTLGQVAGLGIGFVIPIFLSRWLTVEAYGTYKQLMFLYVLALLTVHMGIDWGLFYFIKREPSRAPLFSLNVMLVDLGMATLVIAVGVIGGNFFAALLKNPELALYFPAFAPFLLFSVPAHHFHHYLVVLDRIKAAFWLMVIFESTKALIILAGYFFFNSLFVVLWGLGALALVRLLALLWWNLYLCGKYEQPLREHRANLREQIRFALPLGISNLVTLLLRLDRFIVSSFFGLKSFTVYSVGCFELPVVENTVTTMADLMSFDMVEARKTEDWEKIKTLWLSTLKRIALLHLPLAVFSIVFAREIITFIYSETYAESASYFVVFSLIFLLPSFTPEVIFRVFAKPGWILRIRAVAVVYTLSFVAIFAWALGPLGALYGKLAADLITAVVQLTCARRLMNLSAAEILPYKEIAAVTLVSATAAVTLQHFPLPVLFAFPLYAAILIGVALLAVVFSKADHLSEVKRSLWRTLRLTEADQW